MFDFLRQNRVPTESGHKSDRGTERVYLDYAAATPVHSEVLQAMLPFWQRHYGNAGAIHQEGRSAKQALEHARTQIARLTQVRPELVTFTSGGTESNNLAIIGYVETLREAGRSYESMHILTTPIEHPATVEALKVVAARGVKVEEMAVDEVGLVKLATLQEKLTPETVMVTLAHINSEIGTIQPTQRIKRMLRAYEQAHDRSRILLHIDAAQSPLWQPIQLPTLGADVLSLDAGKCEGPKGVGVLITAQKPYITHGVLYGGGQEHGLRSGTEPIALCVGCAEALTRAQATRETRSAQVLQLRDTLQAKIATQLPEAIWNGAVGKDRVANNINISLPGYDTEYAAIVLDQAGFAVSTKSACSTADSAASAVISAISQDAARARSTLRITLHPEVAQSQLARLVDALVAHVAQMRPFLQ